MNLSLLKPEWAACACLLFFVGLDLIKGEKKMLSPNEGRLLSALSILACGLLGIVVWFSRDTGEAFSGLFQADAFSHYFKLLFTGMLGVQFFISHAFFTNKAEKPAPYFLVLWVTLLGMFFLASANDLFVAFIAVEIVTLSFYILTAYRKHDILSIEAGLKYLIMGSLASALMIFGIGLIYVAAGSTHFDVLAGILLGPVHEKLVLTGFLMLLCGIGFKIAAFPFQFWAPDVYQGAPTPTVAFLSVGSKTAGFVFLLRLLSQVFFMTTTREGIWLFSGLAVMTLIYGNLGALHQSSMKRLLGYSSIGHAGYLLIGIAAGLPLGHAAVFYYLLAYAVTNLTVFTVLVLVGRSIESDQISAYSGLARRSPFLAACLFVALISLAGVPPTAGFFGKFLVLLAAVQSGLGWLALVGLIFVVVSLYYYLLVIRTLYVAEPESAEPIRVSLPYRILLGLLVAGIFVLGLYQSPFYSHILIAVS